VKWLIDVKLVKYDNHFR